MAENAATQETSLPGFIRAGMDFFTGKTVLKSTLDDANALLASARDRIKELEPQAGEVPALKGKISTLEADVKTRDETIKAHLATIDTLKANYETAARQAQQQIAQAGAQKPANTPAPLNPAPEAGAKDFPALVAEKVKAGMKKADAVIACVREFKAEHAAWLASGKTSQL
jgi:hypothetical protein